MTTTEPTQSVQPNRGGCLTAFLVLMLVANPLVAIYYFFAASSVRQSLPNIPAWIIPVLGLISAANLVFAIAIWKWKRWGMYAFIASAGITFLINTAFIGILTALPGLIGPAFLAFLLRDVWKQMV